MSNEDDFITVFKERVARRARQIANSIRLLISAERLNYAQIKFDTKKFIKNQKDFLVQGLVLTAMVLPMLAVPILGAKGPVGGANTKLGLANGGRHKRLALASSRGTMRAKPAPAKAASPAPAPKPAPKPAPAPPRNPNLPPTLTRNTQHINPVLLRRFDAFRTAMFQKYRVVLEIKSGWRSHAEQAQLYNTLPRGRANPPGTSQHESGNAIDYTPFSPTYNQYLGQFGLKAPYAGKENWHIEIVEPH